MFMYIFRALDAGINVMHHRVHRARIVWITLLLTSFNIVMIYLK